MAQRKGTKKEIIPEESLPFIQQIACMQMNLSDAYYFLSCFYMDDVAVAGVGAYIQDQAVMKWYHAKESMKYIVKRGNKVCLPDIQRPELDLQSSIGCITTVLSMEKELTMVLQRLFATAFNIGDTDTLNFVRELVSKQTKNEEYLANEIAEREKQQAEQQKQQAEQEKQQAEQEKQQAEQEKQQAEQEKQQAEQEKQQAEQEKQQAEQEKQAQM